MFFRETSESLPNCQYVPYRNRIAKYILAMKFISCRNLFNIIQDGIGMLVQHAVFSCYINLFMQQKPQLSNFNYLGELKRKTSNDICM